MTQGHFICVIVERRGEMAELNFFYYLYYRYPLSFCIMQQGGVRKIVTYLNEICIDIN